MAYYTTDTNGNDVCVLDTTYPVARKDYICCICETRIDKGQKHTKQVTVFDGSAGSVRFHGCCLQESCEHKS